MEEEDPVTEEAVDEAQDRLDRLGIHDQVKAGDVFPGQWAPVLSRSAAGAVRFFPMRWGYTGKKLLINARSETADKLPTFADSFLNRRCLIPFSWYYEWGETEEGKVPFAIRPEEEGRFFLAGLYRFEPGEKLPRFTVLTRDAAPQIAFVHPRMPVILPEKLRGDWLRAGADVHSLFALAEKLSLSAVQYGAIQEAIGRVRRMEILFDRVSDALRNRPECLAQDEETRRALETLTEYLDSGTWQSDYELDEKGRLPRDLKRGVLSQDGLYDLISSVQ